MSSTTCRRGASPISRRRGRSAASSRSTISTRRHARAGSLLAMRRPDVLYHLATVTSGSASVECHAAAFGRTLGLLEAARQHGIPKVVVAVPATAIYGRPAAAGPADQGAGARTARCAGRRRPLDRRSADHLPRAVRGRVHGPGDRVGRTGPGNVPTAESSPPSPRRPWTGHRPASPVTAARRATSCSSTTSSTPCARSGERGSGLVVNVGTGNTDVGT